MIHVRLPDNNVKEVPVNTTAKEIVATLPSSVRKSAVVAEVNGQLVDLSTSLQDQDHLQIFSSASENGVNVLRHTAAHVLAQAVRRLYKGVKLGIGPVIDNGFYYDVQLEHGLTESDLRHIEKEMKRIIASNMPIERFEVSKEEAMEQFKGEPFKLEILEGIDDGVSLYEQGEFVDVCRGPHAPSTGAVKHVQLTHVAGAYWRGDKDQAVLQRIYGVAFATKQELDDYLFLREEAKKRDHRKLGKELELFMFSEEAPGMPFYLPNGQVVRQELIAFSREEQSRAFYDEVATPSLMNQRLWEQSGHFDHYKDNMYFSEVDKAAFALKPMNCPGHMLVFKHGFYSYRDLPVRMAEYGHVHRHEFSGALNRLLRVRSFCQDDAHIFVREDQIESEIRAVMELIDRVYTTLGFRYSVELSTRPEDSLGDDSLWEASEAALERVLKNSGVAYQLNEGDGAFYGPKIDFHIKDALRREHQCATIQLDFQMPEKFDLSYIDERGERVRPVVIHRAIFGSLDRFFGILIEHFAGAFPLWLAPKQVKVIPVSAVHQEYCEELAHELRDAGVRVSIDGREEKLGYRIRESQLAKVPYTLVVGDAEVANRSVQVRRFGEKSSAAVAFKEFKEAVAVEVRERRLRGE